jgi:transcriptional regulator with XRE-family HTH domain
MTVFCYKKIDPVMRLGQRIKKTREERGLDFATVSKLTMIPVKYLEALENGKYSKLPKARAHRLAYIRELTKIFQLPTAELIEQFENESGFADTPLTHPKRAVRMFPFASISIFIRNISAFAMVFLFAGYLVWQVRGILEPPRLAIFSPSEGYIANSPHTIIEGETEKESRLTVNGQDVMVNEEGKFSAQIDLSAGVNTIQISATKKHGKTTTITRHIVVKLPTNREPVSLNN